jgi:hypothetical protein
MAAMVRRNLNVIKIDEPIAGQAGELMSDQVPNRSLAAYASQYDVSTVTQQL